MRADLKVGTTTVTVRLKPDTTECAIEVAPYRGLRQRPGAPVKQTMEAARQRSGQNTRAGHLREDQTWSERHGSEQQMPATCFAAPTILFAEPVLPDADASGRAGRLRQGYSA